MNAGHIKNPLTVIAIFAGVTEVGGTFVLPHITDVCNQRIYIGFLIVFPTYLITLFFLMLWKKHTHLYAPSDYSNESNFVAAAGTQVFAKIEEEIREDGASERSNLDAGEIVSPSDSEADVVSPVGDEVTGQVTTHQATPADTDDPLQMHLHAEDLAFRRLEAEFGTKFSRRVSPGNRRDLVFDGVRLKEEGGIDVVEVRYTRHPYYNSILTMRTFKQTVSYYWSLSETARLSFGLVFVVVFDGVPEDGRYAYLQALRKDLDGLPFLSELRGYDLAVLRKKYSSGEQGSLF